MLCLNFDTVGPQGKLYISVCLLNRLLSFDRAEPFGQLIGPTGLLLAASQKIKQRQMVDFAWVFLLI